MSRTKNLVATLVAALALVSAPLAGIALGNVGNAVPVACNGSSGGGCTI
jgi:hypothetical protein